MALGRILFFSVLLVIGVQMIVGQALFQRLQKVDPEMFEFVGSPKLFGRRRAVPPEMWAFMLHREYRSYGDRRLLRLGNALVGLWALIAVGLVVAVSILMTESPS